MRFEVLGPVRVVRDGQVLPITSGRQQALLANLLIARGGNVPADSLIEGVWGDDLPANPANTLQHAVAQARKLLEPGRARSERPKVLISEGGGYRLALEGHEFDVAELEAGVDEGRRLLDGDRAGDATSRLQEALDLWRGPAYSGFGFADFAVDEVERLNELRIEARELLVDARAATKGAHSVIGELEALVADNPHRGGLWVRLMRALHQTGRQAEAVRVFQRATRTLAGFGIEPSPELRDLEEQVLLEDPSLAADIDAAKHNLPEAATSLVGRRAVLDQLLRLVQSSRLTTVVGPGGSGKTRVAVEAARRLAGSYRDGVWLVRLEDLRDPVLLPVTVGTALGMPEDRGKPVLATLTSFLDSKELLLVFDDCGHLAADAADVIETILQACPSVTVLATSQTALNINGEHQLPLPPLQIPGDRDSPPDDVDTVPAVQLFMERARSAEPSFDAGREAIAAAANIVTALGGMPLAIELAAGHADVLTAAEIAQPLADAVGDGSERTAPQEAQRVAIEWSYRFLDDQERAFFRQLAVFSGSFDVAAAAAVARIDEARALDLVSRLLRRALVARHLTDAPTSHYRMLETLRVFGVEQLQGAGELAGARGRHLDYFAVLSKELDDGLQTTRQLAAFAALVEEQDNMRAAMAWSLETGRLEPGIAIAVWNSRFWDWRGSLAEAWTWINRFLDARPSERARNVALLTSWAGFFAWELGQQERAAELAAEGLRIATEHGDRLGLAASLTGTALQARIKGNPTEASRRNAEIRSIASELAEPWLKAWADNHDGLSLLAAGHVAAAEAAARQSLQAFTRLGDKRATGWALTVLAQVALEQQRYERTIDLAERAVELSRSSGDGRNAFWALELAAEASRATGDGVSAERFARAAADLNEERSMAQSPWKRAD